MAANQQALLMARADPFETDVVLLLRMEGADAGTTFTDSSVLVTNPVATSGFTTESAQKKSGISSCYCTGGGGKLALTPSGSHLLDGDYTIETWARFDAGATQYLFGISELCSGDSFNYNVCNIGRAADGGVLTFDEGAGCAGSPTTRITGGTSVANSTWVHVAETRLGTLHTLWVGGSSEGTYTGTVHSHLTNGNAQLYIGSYLDGSGMFKGYLDLFRVTKACRYTSAFTPPTDY